MYPGVRATGYSARRIRQPKSHGISPSLLKAAIVIACTTVLVIAGLMGGTQEALARGRGARADPRPGPRGQRALKAVETVRVRMLMREVRATDRQRRIIRQAYAEAFRRKQALLRERVELLRKMRELASPGEPADLTQRERGLRRLVDRYRELEQRIAKAQWSTEESILKHLAPSQRVRYILFNERFEKELRQRIGAIRQRRHRSAPSVPPPVAPE